MPAEVSNGLAEAIVTWPPVNALSALTARRGLIAAASATPAKTLVINRMLFFISLFEIRSLSRRLLVLGAGPAGIEMAQAFSDWDLLSQWSATATRFSAAMIHTWRKRGRDDRGIRLTPTMVRWLEYVFRLRGDLRGVTGLRRALV